MRETVRQFLVYAVFAGVATVVDMGILFALTSVVGLHYFWSAAFGYCGGMITNYSLNRTFTFKNTSTRVATQASVFALVALIGLALNQAIIVALVEGTGVHVLIAKVVAVGIVAFWSFWGHKRFTFGLIHKGSDHLSFREVLHPFLPRSNNTQAEREPIFERGSLYLLGVIFLFALLVRYVATDFSAIATFTGDSYLYLLKAIEIAQGNWVPPYSHAIGTSILLAPFVWFLEPISRFELMPYARIFGVISGALAVVPTWLIARQFLDRFTTALVTLTIAAHPWLIYYSTVYSSDGPFLVLSLMALYFCIRSLDRPHHILYATLFAALSYYLRANGLFVLGVVVLTYFIAHMSAHIRPRSFEAWGRLTLAIFGLVAVFFALSAPFLIGRYEAFGSPFTYGQNDKYFVEDFTLDVWTPNVPVPTFGEYLSSHSAGEVFYKFAIDGFVKLAFSMVHGWEPNSFSSVIIPILLLPFIGGLFLCISTRRFVPVALFIGIFIAGLVPVYAVFAEGRYIVPIIPLVAFISFVGIRHAVGAHRLERTVLATLTLAIVLWSLITPAMILMKRADHSALPDWAYFVAKNARGTLVSFDEGDYPMMLLPDTTVAGRNLSELKAPETGLEIIRYGKFTSLQDALEYHRDPRGTWLILSDRTVALKPYLRELDEPRYQDAVPVVYDERGKVPGSTVRLHVVDWDKLSDLGKE